MCPRKSNEGCSKSLFMGSLVKLFQTSYKLTTSHYLYDTKKKKKNLTGAQASYLTRTVKQLIRHIRKFINQGRHQRNLMALRITMKFILLMITYQVTCQNTGGRTHITNAQGMNKIASWNHQKTKKTLDTWPSLSDLNKMTRTQNTTSFTQYQTKPLNSH